MPAPEAEALSTTAKENFTGQGIALPVQWESKGVQYPDAFEAPELSTSANSADNLFNEPTLNKYHTQAAGIMGRAYERYIDGICAALAEAIDKWMKTASIVSVALTGTMGTVMPEATTGPELKAMILAKAPRATQKEQAYSLAIATAVSDNWALWQQGLSGILAYPPFGPPGPNIPAPLISFGSAGEANLEPDHLVREMMQVLDTPDTLHAKVLFDSVARAFYSHFQIFKATSLITGVIMTPPPPAATLASGAAETGLSGAESAAETMAGDPPTGPGMDEIDSQAMPEPITGGAVIPTSGNFV